MKFLLKRALPVTVLVMLVVRCAEMPASAKKPYKIVYSDGRTIEGVQIQNDQFLAHGRSSAQLDSEAIFRPGKQVRLIRNRSKEVHLQGPYIEFVNGDILPGQVEAVEVASPGRNLPAHMQVRLSGPLMNHMGMAKSLVRVHAKHVARLVVGVSKHRPAKSGYLWLKSGASFEISSVRWQPDGLQVLTNQGVKTIAIHDVAQWQQPVKERMRWMRTRRPDVGLDPSGHRVMFHVINGARLTAREQKLIRHSDSRTIVQPSWALDAITLSPEHIAEVRFLGLDEFPLADLPVATLSEKNYFGKWKWARNRNVRGGRLESADRSSSIGVGTHAHTAIAFYLPPGAESFSSWLGIDRAVGDGGCALASVYLDDHQSKPLWKSPFLRGGQPAVRVGPLSVKDKERLVLVADFGHEGRPQGADPFDVRDEIDWIDSIVKTKPPESTPPRLEELFAFLNEWTISEKDRSRLSATQTWSSQEGRWVHALKLAVPPGSENIKQKAPMLLGKPGVHFEHYIEYTEANLPDFDKLTPKTTGTHPTISLEIPDLPLDRVALRFKTTLVVPRDGFYSFFLKSDDGSKMYINGKEVLNNDGLHPVIEKVTRVALRKGGVPIQVEYFNGAGVRHLSLEWKGPGFPRQIIKPESFDLAKIDASSGPEVEYVALEPITLNRTVKITSANEWLSLRAGRDENGIGDYVFEVRVNGKTIPEMAQKEVHTRYLQPMQLAGGIWHLGDHAGRTINLQVAIKPLGYHGQQVPALHFQQLQSGPESPERKDRFIAKDLLGDWRLEGSLSTINKSYHNGLLSGGDGALRLAPDGTVAMWLRLPSGERKAGAGYVVRLDNAMVFDYVNADWVTDSVQPSSDRKSLIVQEQEAESSWNLIFTRNELSSFAEYAGQWKLQAEVSKVDNTVHSGMFAGGSGSLSIGRDGGVRIQLQYPPNAQGQVQNGGSIGQLVRKEGDVIIKYEDETWNDDRVEWSDDRKSLTVRELKNAEGWTLVFVKR